MTETNAIDRWIYSTLTGDAALGSVVSTRVYSDIAPSTASMPYVTFQFQTGRDLMVVGGNRVWADVRYQVKAIDEVISYGGDLATAADRIDAVLHRQDGVNIDGTVYSCVREQPLRVPEIEGDRQYRHLGGVYRLQAK